LLPEERAGGDRQRHDIFVAALCLLRLIVIIIVVRYFLGPATHSLCLTSSCWWLAVLAG